MYNLSSLQKTVLVKPLARLTSAAANFTTLQIFRIDPIATLQSDLLPSLLPTGPVEGEILSTVMPCPPPSLSCLKSLIV